MHSTSHHLSQPFSRDSKPEKKTICVVDDEISGRMLLEGILCQAGYKVLMAEDGHVALELVERHDIDLILLDIQMPGIDGFEVCKQIVSSTAQNHTIPIIFVSGMNVCQSEEQGLRLGAVDYISKPIVPAILLARIKTQLELQSRRQELVDQNARLVELTEKLGLEIDERNNAEKRLRDYQMSLESIVDERTKELFTVNKLLQQEITERKQTEKALIANKRALNQKSTNSEEANNALKILLQKSAQEKKDFEMQVSENLMHLVEPYLAKLSRSGLTEKQQKLAKLISINLENVLSPVVRCAVAQNIKFSPVETQVVTFIRQGNSSKEIADIMCISPRTVDVHRRNIRKKIGLVNKKITLQTLLSSP